jgi:hydroxymethylpyrimidine/phosphomethylpyrimidine kinase
MLPPVILSIAGSDNSAGAGAQADLKTISALGGYGLTAITCVVAEVPGKVSAIQAVEPEVVAEQVRLSLEAFPVAAIKTGMLYSEAIIESVVNALREVRGRIPLVVDPVMVASSGDSLLAPGAVALYRARLLPLAAIATPNLDETGVLLGRKVDSLEGIRAAGRELSSCYGCAFLVKGGHLRGPVATDVLVHAGGTEELHAHFVAGVSTHGTGCTYSAAIATGLARGLPLPEAVREAKEYVTRAISQHLRWPRPGRPHTDALHHFARRI